jgi:osmotically-inducible protein OsmY
LQHTGTIGLVPDQLEDDLIIELARSEISRCCSSPAAITVTCTDGVVRLEGPILKSELRRVLRCVTRIPGIREIHDQLEAHRLPMGIPGLDGNAKEGSQHRTLQPV